MSDFSIAGFRGLQDLKIENLGQVNLFVGNNNSGKTSVLEATSIFCDPLNWRKWYDLGSQREVAPLRTPVIDRIIWTFPSEGKNNSAAQIESPQILLEGSGSFLIKRVSASYEKFTEIQMLNRPRLSSQALDESPILEEREVEIDGIKINISVSVNDSQRLFDQSEELQETIAFSDFRTPSQLTNKQRRYFLPSQIVNQFTHRTSGLTAQFWSEVVKADLKAETIDLLRFFDPAIEDIDIISPSERQSQVSIKHQKLGRAPLFTFGDGLRRVFTLATAIPRVRNGLLLIDELETAIHTQALEKTFGWLINACSRHNVQLFATTHSLEALDSILEVSREHTNLVIYRLQQNEKQTVATRFDKELTLRLREELGMELRY